MRTIAPKITSLSLPELIRYDKYVLPNGVAVYIFNDPKQEVFKADIIFNAGIYYQPQPLVASATVNMLNEGTQRHSSAELAEIFDYYGASVDCNAAMRKSEVSLFSLNKYAPETIKTLGEMLLESTLPETELSLYLNNKKQAYLVDKEKTSWTAQKLFLKLLFGQEHPYSRSVEEKDYDSVSRNMLLDFFKERYNAANCSVVLSGNVTESIMKQLSEMLMSLPVATDVPTINELTFFPSPAGSYVADSNDPNKVQCSLRVGKTGVGINDEDYAGFQLLNTVLGGYFGSRLMSNIREEKGYTYGIYSFNANIPGAAYWCVSSDVNKEYAEATNEEIRKEIRLLQTELIEDEELEMVKNYFYGELLRELDGVFAQSDSFKNKLVHGLDNTFYLSLIARISDCNAKQLRELANKYLLTDEMYFVMGK
ncbi:MAG: insulinase family protein [Culturomica sp.]|jgi:predicted Zn-dependent peptidase|nr:insulinase family protein [Culturomica sp.]